MLLDRAYGAPPPSKFDRDAPLSAHDVAAMRALSAAQGEKAWVYGEITALGASLAAEACGITEQDVLYDLGSGHGRLVLQAHLQWCCVAAVGVELSRERNVLGERALAVLREMGHVDESRRVALLNDNLMNVDCSPASVVYLGCTMWDEDFVWQVLKKLDAEAKGLRLLLSTEDIEARFGLPLPPWLRLERALQVPMTWADDASLYIYTASRQ